MAALFLQNDSLTDQSVSERLAVARNKIECKKLYLNNNVLQSSPRLTGAYGFPSVQVLSLANNRISNICIDDIPVKVTELHLESNNLTTMHDWSSLINLKQLFLIGNKIEGALSGKLLPLHIEMVMLSDNKINRVFSMSHLSELTTVALDRNEIIEVNDLPPNCKSARLCGNPLIKMNKGCFTHENQYDALMKPRKCALKNDHISRLQYPPRDVFSKGWKYVIDYFNTTDVPDDEISKFFGDVNEKENLVTTCSHRVFVGGEKEYGKSSLVRCLIDNMPYTTHSDERTHVVDYNTWKLDDETTVPIYDLGGHPCYKYLAHLFHANSLNNLAIIPHLLSSNDYHLTSKWITDVVTRSPKCSVQLVLSQSDKANKANHPDLKSKYIKAMSDLLESEIDVAKLSLKKVASEETKEHLKDVVKNYETIKFELKNVHIVSCANLDGFTDFRKKIINIVKFPSYKIKVPRNVYALYMRLGNLGLKHTKIESKLPNMQNDNDQPVTAGSIQYFDTASSNPYSCIPSTSSNEVIVNSKFIRASNPSDTTTIDKSVMFVTFDQALDIYTEIVTVKDKETDVISELKECLQFLHSHGLMIWYNDSPELQQLIFNNLYGFFNMLKTLFQHKATDLFSYDAKSDDMKREFLIKEDITEAYYKQLTQDLLKRGLFSIRLLHIFTKRFRLENHKVTVVELLQHLKIAYLIPLPDENTHKRIGNTLELTRTLFFPWYVEMYGEPLSNEFMEMLNNIKKPDSNSYTIKAVVKGYLPYSFFRLFCVAVYKHLMTRLNEQDRRIWKDGLYAALNRIHILFEHKMQKQDAIHIDLKCPLKVKDVRKSWEIVRNCLEEIQKLGRTWWPCLATDVIRECLHCHLKLNHALVATNLHIHGWPLDILLKTTTDSDSTISCPEDRTQPFPSTLIFPLPQDNDEAKECVEQLQRHIKEQIHVSTVLSDKRDYDMNLVQPRPHDVNNQVELPFPVQDSDSTQHDLPVQVVGNQDNKEYYPMTLPAGRGLVVLFVNFTGELEGYINDICRIKAFFENILEYPENNILIFKNLCKREFMEKLGEVQIKLNRMVDIERLYVFIMSHGSMEGVAMCEQGSDCVKEVPDGNPVSIDVIIKAFQHDKVRTLTDKPKLIFLQICRGTSEIQAACITRPDQSATIHRTILGADTLIGYSTLFSYKSWVSQGSGSYYIQALIDEFEAFYENKELLEMLTAVNKKFSKRDTGLLQMTEFQSRLTKKFQLYSTEILT